MASVGKPMRAQPAGDRGDHAVGLGKGEPARRPVGEGLPVGRVGERQRVGPPLGEAAEHLLDGEAVARVRRRRRGGCGIAEDHCSARFGWCHQVSGR